MTKITWCVAHTQPLKEHVAQKHLLDQGYGMYLPQIKKTCRHARKIDRLNKLEKYGILTTVRKWQYLRNLRNNLAHEYPYSYEILATNLNEVFNNYRYLEQTLDRIKDEYASRS